VQHTISSIRAFFVDPGLRRAMVLVIVASAATGCNSATAPGTTTVSPTTQLLVGTVAAGGSSFVSFAHGLAGTVSVTLTSLASASGALVTPSVTLSLGLLPASGCTTTVSVTATPGLVAQINGPQIAGNYCVTLTDSGSKLTDTTTYTLRVVHN
jgi:hypothetical protein